MAFETHPTTQRGLEELPLEEVCAAVNFMFEQCRQQLKAYAGAA